MPAVSGSPFSALHTSKPDTSGMSMSSRIRSGRGLPPAISMAVPASLAPRNSYSSASALPISKSSSSVSSTARMTGLAPIGQRHHGQPERVDRLHHHDELLEVHRRGDEAVGMQVVAAQHVLLGLRCGEHHHRDAPEAVVGLDLLQHLASVLARQVEVEQDDLGARRGGVLALAPQEGHRLHAVPGPVQVAVDLAFLQRLARQPLVTRVVLDQQDVDRLVVSHHLALFHFRQREAEGRARAGPRLDPDAPAVALDHLLADGEADAGAGILAHRVQALEDLEDALEEFRLYADAVVFHGNLPGDAVIPDPYVDARHLFPPELEGIADQVLEYLAELQLLAEHRGQRVVRHGAAALGERALQVAERTLERCLNRNRLELLARSTCARIGEQVLDELLHARGAVDDVAHELCRVAFEALAIAALEKLGVARDGAQRLLQVVRSDRGELLQLGVRAGQLLV